MEDVYAEAKSADDRQTTSWALLKANGWTVRTPSREWHLSASTAGGADVGSPDGGSDASLGVLYAQTPWTTTRVVDKLLSETSDVKTICRSPVEHASSGSGDTQAVEVTGTYRGAPVHAIVIASVLTPTGSGEYTAETRVLFTPASQWTTSAVRELTLILKLAIFAPS